MYALAKDTGGAPVFNTNALDVGVSNAMKETSVYYLLAWRPDQDTQAGGKFRHIAVTLPGRKDLTVRVRQGFFDVELLRNHGAQEQNLLKPPKPPESQLREAINATYPRRNYR